MPCNRDLLFCRGRFVHSGFPKSCTASTDYRRFIGKWKRRTFEGRDVVRLSTPLTGGVDNLLIAGSRTRTLILYFFYYFCWAYNARRQSGGQGFTHHKQIGNNLLLSSFTMRFLGDPPPALGPYCGSFQRIS